MKPLSALPLILSCCAFAAGDCVEVKGPETKPSFRNAKIALLLDGKQQVNVNVTVTMYRKGPVIVSNGTPQGKVKATDTLPEVEGSRSFVTDSSGTVLMKDLPVGIDCVAVTEGKHFRADLCLAVSQQSKDEISSFTLALVDTLPPAPALGNVQAAEKNARPERLHQLKGVVIDPAGGVVPDAEIQVHKHGSYSQNHPVVEAWTDQEGRFTVPLSPDTYTIIIRMAGFRAAIHVIEISPEGQDAELREVLQLGGCTQTVVFVSKDSK